MGPYELLKKIVEALENLRIPYLVTGSVAAMAYGEPRLTNDIDIVADINEKNIPGLIDSFPPDEFYLSADMIRQAIIHRGQFNIIHPVSGLKVDIFVKRDTPFEHSRFRRIRRIQPAESYQANFAAPEDIIIKKMEFYQKGSSEKHLRDITGILKISGPEIDYAYITEWSKNLGLTEIWAAVQKRMGKR